MWDLKTTQMNKNSDTKNKAMAALEGAGGWMGREGLRYTPPAINRRARQSQHRGHGNPTTHGARRAPGLTG